MSKKRIYVLIAGILCLTLASCGPETSHTVKYDNPTSQEVTPLPDQSGGQDQIPSSSSWREDDAATIPEPPPAPGAAVHSFPYPDGITWIGDLAVVGTTAWALAGDQVYLDRLIQVDLESGGILQDLVNDEFFLNHGSEIAWDGSHLWVTSYGTSNGFLQSFICQFASDGSVDRTKTIVPCPASGTDGYCEGLSWDGEAFWSFSSINKDLTRFAPDGTVLLVDENLRENVLASVDLTANPYGSSLLMLEGNLLIPIDMETGSIGVSVTLQGVSGLKGDRGGSLLWVADNGTQAIKAFYIGDP